MVCQLKRDEKVIEKPVGKFHYFLKLLFQYFSIK